MVTTGVGYQEWNNLGVSLMLAKIGPRLGITIIFTTIVVSLCIVKYQF